jgi:hypothetical protein
LRDLEAVGREEFNLEQVAIDLGHGWIIA